MTKYFLLFLLFAQTSFAQQDSCSKVHIGFVFPLSTNGQYAKNYSNDFSFHLLAGLSANENAFCFSGISNLITHNSKGLAFAGVVNYFGNDVSGLQLSGFSNIIGGVANGVQMAGFQNIISGKANGAQLAGFTNISLESNSQIAGFSNISKHSTRCQIAGFSNIAQRFNGVQISGFSNIAKGVDSMLKTDPSFQSKKQNRGLQLTGFANIANDIEGVQIAGFINIAKRVKGVQVAGFINIADSCEYPIGLVNIIGNGEKYLGLSIDETGTSLATLRSGSKKIYGILGAGFNFPQPSMRYGLEGGLGIHFPINLLFRINTELTVLSLSDLKNGVFMKSSVRVFPSMKFGRRFEIFAGPTFNFSNAPTSLSNKIDIAYLWSKNSNGTFYGMNIGGILGCQIRL